MCPKLKPWQCILLSVLVFVVLAVSITCSSSRPQPQEVVEVTVYSHEPPEVPGPRAPPRAPRRRPLVPSVMMDLFHRGPHEQLAAEIVRSLTPRTVGPAHHRHPEGAAREHLHLLTFDIPRVPSGETLHSAQLRLMLAFLDHNLRPARGVDSTVNVYWESTEAILSQRVRDQDSEQKVVLNCTALIERFHKQRNTLGGELQLVVGVAVAPGHQVHPLVSGDHVDKQPLLLLLYSPSPSLPSKNDTTQLVSEEALNRHERDTSAEDYEEDTNRIWSGALVKSKQRKPRNLCRRKPLYVEFSDIQYDTWIVAPSGYQAYQCVGRCVYPLSDHLTPTKHAIIQTLLHGLQPTKAYQCVGRCVYPLSDHLTPTKHAIIQTLLHGLQPTKAQKSCCVPTQLDSISILYLDSQGVLTYRLSYKDMVVTECGCR